MVATVRAELAHLLRVASGIIIVSVSAGPTIALEVFLGLVPLQLVQGSCQDLSLQVQEFRFLIW